MLTLALELSTSRGSAALVRDTGQASVRRWDDSVRQRQKLFDAVHDLLAEQQTGFEAIDFYTVGRGPGSFSGMRVAFATASGFALPDNKEIFAVSSGEALAEQILKETGAESIAVIGDARREKYWIGLFPEEENRTTPAPTYRMVDIDQLDGTVPDGAWIVTSEFERTGARLREKFPRGHLIEESRFPDAAVLGRLALKKKQAGIPSEEHEPLYLHPPVFVSPRYK